MSDYPEGHARARYLPRLSIDSVTYHRRRSPVSVSSMSSLSSSTRASIAPSYDSSSSGDSFFVFCVYDFEAADADQLSFRGNEILEVVKQEESGWWAAIREGDQKVGWIPSAYVEPISEETVEELRACKERRELYGAFEGDAKQLHDAVPISTYTQNTSLIPDYEWISMVDDTGKPLPPTPHESDLPKDVTSPAVSPIFSPDQTPNPYSPGQELLISPSKAAKFKAYPPSPLIPMPQPPPKSAPLTTFEMGRSGTVKRSLSCPQPAVPVKQNSPLDHARSVRRRPVLIEDSLSLKRLSVLLEAHGAEEVEDFIQSPVLPESVSGSMRSHSSRSTDKVRKITGDAQAQALHEAKTAQASYPWYLRPIHGDDQIQLEYDGAIKAGTLPAIVERLTLEPLNPMQAEKLRHVFFRTFRTFGSANEIFDLFLERYHLDVPHAVTAAELEEWRVKRLVPTQKRVLSIFMTWLVDHDMVEEDPPIARRLQDFLSEIRPPSENATMAAEVMQALERLTFAVPATPVLSGKPHKRKKTKDSKNELLRTEPTLLAEQLCLYEHRFYSKIRPQECLDWVKTRVTEKVGNLLAFCALHDKLAAWVKQSILWTENLGRRADTVDFWIKVAEKCSAMHNYSSMSAIATALSSTVISKLHLTWAHVGRASHLDSLTKFNDPSSSFAPFRRAQQALEHDADASCVPFIGMYLTDVVHINDQHKDKDTPAASISGDSVSDVESVKPSERYFNFVKRRKWSDTIDAMLAFQHRSFPFAQDPAIMQFIEMNFVVAAEKDPASFWTKSQEVLQAEVASADIRKGLEAAGF